MNILVGDLAKLYGISSQTLHYYEERNILHPKRDVMNGYRYYETSDLPHLGSIKKYRNAGFSLNESIDIYDNAKESEVPSYYIEQKKALWKEIEEKQHIIHQLDDDLAIYMRYRENPEAIIIEELEGFLRFESRGSQIIFQDQRMRNEAIPWFKDIFYTSGSQMFYLDKELNCILSSTHGMVATLTAAKYLNLKVTENVELIKAGKFLTSIINTNINKDFEKALFNCMYYIKEKNLKIRGNPFTKTLFIFKDDNNSNKVLEQILIPIA